MTLDQIKKIDVEENYDVWKEYAYQARDPSGYSLLSGTTKRPFLPHRDYGEQQDVCNGQRMGGPVAKLLKSYEALHKKADREVVHQYIQHWKIAKGFRELSGII